MSSSLYGADSTSRLILLPNTEDDLIPHTTDEQDDNEATGTQPTPTLTTPLAPSIVFLYLLSPYLRLGAINAFNIGGISLTHSLIGLAVTASLSAICRQIWFLLGRYLNKSSTEDIFIHAFSWRYRSIRKHSLARYIFTIVSALFRVLLAAMYLRDAVDAALLLKLPAYLSPSRLNASILLSVLALVLSLPKSLASKSIIYTTSLSVASYMAWLVAVSRSYDTNERGLFRRGVLWNEISSFAFACATTMTVPLSASLLAGTPSVLPGSKSARARSFEFLNVFSTTLATLLIFPLAIIAASPGVPSSTTSQGNLVLGLRIATLVFSIPSVIVSTISLPLYGAVYQFIHTNVALSIIVAATLTLSLVPPTIASILDDVTLFLAVSGAFLLPALAHIIVHYFCRPLSIVVPQEPSSTPSTPRTSTSTSERSPSPSRDPLLERKERLLQRSRFGKRLLWDIAIWTVLIPICCCTFVWAVGRLAGQW